MNWNSVESVSAWHRFFEIGGIVVLALLVVMEIGAYVFGKRLTSLAEAESDRRVEEVRGQLRPRVLPSGTAQVLAAALWSAQAAPPRRIRISFPGNDPDARAYAEEFRRVFEAAGWIIDDFATVLAYGGGDPVGLTLGFSSCGAAQDAQNPETTHVPLDAIPAAFLDAKKAFQAAGIAVETAYMKELPDGVAQLTVGHKEVFRK